MTTPTIASTTQKGTQSDTRAGWWPLIVIAASHLMAVLDTTIMFVALPTAQHSLGLTVTTRQWVVTAYTLAFAALLLLGGRLADRWGARRTLLIGVTAFAIASAIGGASVDGTMLICARAVQGAFAALLVSSTKSLLITVYQDEHQRTKAIGFFTATLTAGLAIGLILGGVITTGLGWRWCLYVNVLLSIVAVVGGRKVLPNVPPRRDVHIDLASVVLASGGMVALVYGLGEVAAFGWRSATVIGALVFAVALLAAFVARQAGKEHPLLPLRVVRDRTRGGGLLAMLCNSISTFGMLLILTYEMQSVLRYSPLRTGLTLVPFAAAAALGSAVLAPRLTVRFQLRPVVVTGLVLSAAGLLLLAGLSASGHSLSLILVAEVVEGLGTGIGGPAILQSCLRGVLATDTGAASAASSAAGQLGSSIGAALLNTIAATATASYMLAHPANRVLAGTVRGYDVAMLCGGLILLVVIIPVALLITTRRPAS